MNILCFHGEADQGLEFEAYRAFGLIDGTRFVAVMIPMFLRLENLGKTLKLPVSVSISQIIKKRIIIQTGIGVRDCWCSHCPRAIAPCFEDSVVL